MNVPLFQDTLKTSKAYKLIRGDFEQGLGHAYLVVSPDDDALASLFTLIASTVFCENGSACFDCNECLKVVNRNNPDVYYVNEDNKEIKVKEILELTESTELKSYSGRKLYFVFHAEKMNVVAQNKLLKTLEEPPAGVTIFLGASNETAMIETIRSRCRTVYLDAFDRETVYRAMISAGVSPKTAEVATDCSEGMLGKAYKIAKTPEYAGLYSSVLYLLGRLNRSGDVITLDRLAPMQNAQKDDFLDVMTIILRDMLAVKEHGNMISKHVSEDVKRLADDFSVRAISEILLLVNEARKKLYYKVNAQATFDSLLFSILEVKHKWQS